MLLWDTYSSPCQQSIYRKHSFKGCNHNKRVRFRISLSFNVFNNMFFQEKLIWVCENEIFCATFFINIYLIICLRSKQNRQILERILFMLGGSDDWTTVVNLGFQWSRISNKFGRKVSLTPLGILISFQNILLGRKTFLLRMTQKKFL